MEPLPETREVLQRLATISQVDLTAAMRAEIEQVLQSVPGCVGLSVTLREHELTFTWLATDDRVRLLDAAQFIAGGPCETAAHTGRALAVADLMDEEQWRLLALAGAAIGVGSSLSMPILGADGPIGSVNFYGRDRDSFAGRERTVAEIFGADVESAIMNADLSMRSRPRAERAVESLTAMDRLDVASGILAEQRGLSIAQALERLTDAADRAGVPLEALADLVIDVKNEVNRRTWG